MRTSSAFGPLLIALGVWCAAGHVAISGPPGEWIRVAAPAHAAWFAAAFAAAWLVPGWRTRPLTAVPALAATLAWWPVPLPPAALVWSGRLAWMPIAAAVITAWQSDRRPADETAGIPTSPVRSAVTAGLATLVAASLAGWALAPRLPGGDEPHYLIITQSLLQDGDLEIANNHRNRDYAAYYAGTLNPDKIQNGRNGGVYSIHAPGTSVLVLPGFWMAGYRGAQATIVLGAAITGALVWWLGWTVTRSRGAAWFAWASIVSSATFLFQAVTIFPDGPGALVGAIGAAVFVASGRRRITSTRLILAGAALSALPWFHTRFAVLAAALGGAIGWSILVRPGETTRSRVEQLVALLSVPVVSAAAWFVFFQLLYGTPNPAAPYGTNPDTHLAYVPGGMIALLFDQQFGLLAYAPVIGVAVIGLAGRRGDEAARAARILAAVAVVHAAAVSTYWMWWAGVPATPARFAAAALPLLAVPLALAWTRSSTAGRALARLLLAATVAISGVAFGVDRGALAWNYRNVPRAAWLDWLGSSLDLARGLPSFFWRLGAHDAAGEAHFFAHAALLAGVVIAVAALAWVLRSRANVRPSTLAAGVALLTPMAMLQAGWWWNGVDGVDASRAPLVLLADVAAARPVLRVGPWGWSSGVTPSMLRARAMRTDAADQAARTFAPFEAVPPGQYDVVLTQASPAAGTLTVGMGRQRLATLAVDAQTVATAPVDLPAGAATLVVGLDEALGRSTTAVELVPRVLDDRARGFARGFADYGPVRVYFEDDHVFVEPDGFWVRGGATAAVVVAGGRPSVTVTLSNGPRANALTLDVNGAAERLDLAPSESRAVVLRPPASAPLRIGITSPAGFRPSDDGPSGDHRYLGVRVTLTESGS